MCVRGRGGRVWRECEGPQEGLLNENLENVRLLLSVDVK